jgi:hypothetical protein
MNGPNCRWCNTVTDAEFVDVGVGYVQVTGGLCHQCDGYEMGPYQTDGMISEVEMATMWRGPIEDHEEFSPFNPVQSWGGI